MQLDLLLQDLHLRVDLLLVDRRYLLLLRQYLLDQILMRLLQLRNVRFRLGGFNPGRSLAQLFNDLLRLKIMSRLDSLIVFLRVCFSGCSDLIGHFSLRSDCIFG